MTQGVDSSLTKKANTPSSARAAYAWKLPAAGCALMGEIPSIAEYMEQVKVVNAKAADVYRYMNFDRIAEFSDVADTVTV